MKMRVLANIGFCCIIFGGCVTGGTWDVGQADWTLRNYLDDQIAGKGNGSEYGAGNFYNITEYQIKGLSADRRYIIVRVKAGNKMGGNPVWITDMVSFRNVKGQVKIRLILQDVGG